MNMKITRDVIADLWPLYADGSVGADSRALIEEFLKEDPQWAQAAAGTGGSAHIASAGCHAGSGGAGDEPNQAANAHEAWCAAAGDDVHNAGVWADRGRHDMDRFSTRVHHHGEPCGGVLDCVSGDPHASPAIGAGGLTSRDGAAGAGAGWEAAQRMRARVMRVAAVRRRVNMARLVRCSMCVWPR